MRKFYTLFSREVRGYFHSPIAYIVLIFFLIVSGIDFYFQVSFMNQRQVQYTVQEAFFNSIFFWFAFVLIFPLITMRLFAEEFKLGTIEPLTTVPVRDWQVVLAKFFGALVFYVILWIPTLLYFAIFLKVTNEPAAHSAGAYAGSYGPGSVHSARCELGNARFAGLFLCHRTHGNVLARRDRYTPNCSLREHDHRDADAYAPGVSIPQMEALNGG